jgi:hypothetical protein
LTTNFIGLLQKSNPIWEEKQLSYEALLLMEASHEVHVLYGLRGSTLEQVVQARDDDQASGVSIEMEA